MLQEQVNEWIPTSEVLPDPDAYYVLVVVEQAGYAQPDINMGVWHADERGWRTRWGQPFVGQITHWMPLPALP